MNLAIISQTYKLIVQQWIFLNVVQEAMFSLLSAFVFSGIFNVLFSETALRGSWELQTVSDYFFVGTDLSISYKWLESILGRSGNSMTHFSCLTSSLDLLLAFKLFLFLDVLQSHFSMSFKHAFIAFNLEGPTLSFCCSRSLLLSLSIKRIRTSLNHFICSSNVYWNSFSKQCFFACSH